MFVDAIEESPILALIDRIFEMRRRGEKVLGLHIGEPDFDTPAGIRAAATRALDSGLTHYTSAQGMPELRAAIAHRLRELHHMPGGPDDIVVMPAKFAIYASLLATTQPGDEVLLADPTYLFEQPVRLAGAKPVYFPLGRDFRLDLDALQSAITPRSRLLLLANPANPTGQVSDRQEVRAILEVARDHHLTVVSDETYESLVYDGPHVAAHAVAGKLEGVVTIGSLSKAFAMTGWRAGYVVAPPELKTRFVKIMEHTLTCLPPFIQVACAWGLQNSEAEAAQFREEFRKRRDHLLERLREIPRLSVVPPRGAFYVFPGYDLDVPSTEFCGRLLEEEKLALVPGVAFGPHGEQHVRISYSRPTPELDDGVERLARFLDRHPSSKTEGV